MYFKYNAAIVHEIEDQRIFGWFSETCPLSPPEDLKDLRETFGPRINIHGNISPESTEYWMRMKLKIYTAENIHGNPTSTDPGIREIGGPTALICMYWTVENYDQRFTEAEAPGIEDSCNREFLEQGPRRFSDSPASHQASIKCRVARHTLYISINRAEEQRFINCYSTFSNK